MSARAALTVASWAAVAGSLFLVQGFVLGPQPAVSSTAAIAVDYPIDGSLFPAEITPPTFLYRDPSDAAAWSIEIRFGDGYAPIRVACSGERMHTGEIDPRTVAPSNELPKLTAEQAAAHTWMPDPATWAAIREHTAESPATIVITGFDAGTPAQPVSAGRVTMQISRDPAGAPIFYRDVPLMPNTNDKGVVKPLPADAVGLIQWRLRYLNEPRSKVVMEKLGTCANCHSFSRDGKTLGLDVDGPQNDRGIYALVNVAKETTIGLGDVVQWPTVRDPKVERLRAAFMSQVSPDGRYVVTTIDDPEASHRVAGRTLEDKYFNANFMDYKFLQVFYPTRGILAWYDRETKRLTPLPGADDPKYVQTDGVWSPDGQWVVFARAQAKSPYVPGAPPALFANDPNETQIRYDLYRVPFHEGKGGKPERIAGASANGMSNNFPKVSPDGRWIVFVQCRNGQLMRPDSKLNIVPFAGGTARLMRCNTRLMNSWHTFSPNGRWMAFSSKARSPYTQLYLTHIDAEGNDTPPILVDNTTAANRAVNLPEFVNIAPGGLEHIAAPATEFYRLYNAGLNSMRKNSYREAVGQWREALQLSPQDGKVHYNLACSLTETGEAAEALVEYRRASELAPADALVLARYALALAESGDLDGAIAGYRKASALNSQNAAIEADFGVALFQKGQRTEALQQLEKAVAMDGASADAQGKLGSMLAESGRLAEGIEHLKKAVELAPESVEHRYDLAYAMGQAGDMAGAIPHLEKAVELSGGKDWRCLSLLGVAYEKTGQSAQAVDAASRALARAEDEHNEPVSRSLRAALERYRQAAQQAR